MRAGGETRRVRLGDGTATTVHTVVHPLAQTRIRVVHLSPEVPLETWCEREGVRHAVSGGFTVKPEYEPLGELWVDGRAISHRPFAEPWHQRHAALAIVDGRVVIDYRDRLSARPDGGLLQAGPLLVRDGRNAIAGTRDPEGFSTTCEEFDEDITADREPRLAFAVLRESVLVLAADGRGEDDAGLTLWELADLLVDLGADSALNLDEGEDMERSSPSVSAITLEPNAG